MPDAAQTPQLALRYLAEMSTDIRASLILDRGGALAAVSEAADGQAEEMASLVRTLFDEAGPGATQVEVTTAEGGVFALREHGWTIAAITTRFALPSLIFYDLRSVLSDLEARAA